MGVTSHVIGGSEQIFPENQVVEQPYIAIARLSYGILEGVVANGMSYCKQQPAISGRTSHSKVLGRPYLGLQVAALRSCSYFVWH